MTEPIIYSNNKKYWTGMTAADVKTIVDEKSYRNERAKEKAMNRAILKFEKVDDNKDGILDQEEIKSYNITQACITTVALVTGFLVTIAAAVWFSKEMDDSYSKAQEISKLIERAKSTDDELTKKERLTKVMEAECFSGRERWEVRDWIRTASDDLLEEWYREYNIH